MTGREIRASYDAKTITVYQAYSDEIATEAVRHQKLSASPSFSGNRMTWIKPSWCWMMYRCGYSYKDKRQTRVLALRIRHEHFLEILRSACLASEKHERDSMVVIQWDPERGPRLERLDYRSIQIGIPGSLSAKFVEEWIEGIEDVTDVARRMNSLLDADPDVQSKQLVEQGLMPEENIYNVPMDIVERLQMRVVKES